MTERFRSERPRFPDRRHAVQEHFVLPHAVGPTTPVLFTLKRAYARLDNIGHSPWFNFKFGKFELDNIISEKRILTLSNNGGFYVLYHFIPLGDSNFFGQMGDNQLGTELMGHSANDRTRYSVALLSSNDGNANLPSKNAYSTFITASQAFNAGYQGGVDRVGGYLFLGNAPTYNLDIMWDATHWRSATSRSIAKVFLR